MSEYSNILQRINFFHDMLKVEVSRLGYVEPEKKNSLKDDIMKMSVVEYLAYKEDFEKTKHMNASEINYHRAERIVQEIRKVNLNNSKTSIFDFNLDERSLSILNGNKSKNKINQDSLAIKVNKTYNKHS